MATVRICTVLPDGSGYESFKNADVPGSTGNSIFTIAEGVAERLVVIAWWDAETISYPPDEAIGTVCRGGVIRKDEKASEALALQGETPGSWWPYDGFDGRQAWNLFV